MDTYIQHENNVSLRIWGRNKYSLHLKLQHVFITNFSGFHLLKPCVLSKVVFLGNYNLLHNMLLQELLDSKTSHYTMDGPLKQE